MDGTGAERNITMGAPMNQQRYISLQAVLKNGPAGMAPEEYRWPVYVTPGSMWIMGFLVNSCTEGYEQLRLMGHLRRS